MHLLAAIDDVRLLPGYGRVSGNRDGDAETLFQRAQVRTLMVEDVKCDFRPGAHDQIVRRAFDQHFFDGTQQLQCDRRYRADMPAAAAHRAFFGRAFQHRRADTLA